MFNVLILGTGLGVLFQLGAVLFVVPKEKNNLDSWFERAVGMFVMGLASVLAMGLLATTIDDPTVRTTMGNVVGVAFLALMPLGAVVLFMAARRNWLALKRGEPVGKFEIIEKLSTGTALLVLFVVMVWSWIVTSTSH